MVLSLEFPLLKNRSYVRKTVCKKKGIKAHLGVAGTVNNDNVNHQRTRLYEAGEWGSTRKLQKKCENTLINTYTYTKILSSISSHTQPPHSRRWTR